MIVIHARWPDLTEASEISIKGSAKQLLRREPPPKDGRTVGRIKQLISTVRLSRSIMHGTYSVHVRGSKLHVQQYAYCCLLQMIAL